MDNTQCKTQYFKIIPLPGGRSLQVETKQAIPQKISDALLKCEIVSAEIFPLFTAFVQTGQTNV